MKEGLTGKLQEVDPRYELSGCDLRMWAVLNPGLENTILNL